MNTVNEVRELTVEETKIVGGGFILELLAGIAIGVAIGWFIGWLR
jgi:F0F1-type ATP synthase assembly protein I